MSPAQAALAQPFLQRTLGDIAAALSAPYRLMRLTKITKTVVAEITAERKAKVSAAGTQSSDRSSAAKTFKEFLPSYVKSHVLARTSPNTYEQLLNTSLHLLVDSIYTDTPYSFAPYHQAIRNPVDLYAWGNDFFRSMVKYRASRVEGLEHVAKIKQYLAAGDNVILLANHQTEADPQVLSILLEKEGHGDLAEKTIFVAGHKVTTDRLAVPFSMGRNLLTIFSKKYLNTFEEAEREVKSARNRETVAEMQRLFTEGGHVFWVAPSGGRDRRSAETGRFDPAKFDDQSVGLFFLLGQKAEKGGGPKTRFFPLAMWTHRLVPPPEGAKADVGEARTAKRAPIAIELGPELVPEEVGGRKGMAEAAETLVKAQYLHLHELMR